MLPDCKKVLQNSHFYTHQSTVDFWQGAERPTRSGAGESIGFKDARSSRRSPSSWERLDNPSTFFLRGQFFSDLPQVLILYTPKHHPSGKVSQKSTNRYV
jgi:hypothetical protein